MKNHMAIVLLAGTLTGCQSTAEDDPMQAENFCTNSNWTEVGRKVALSGKSVRTFLSYQERCEALPEEAKNAYLDGFTAGVKEYCTYENGFKAGDTGAINTNACPLELRGEYEKGFVKGQNNLKSNKAEMQRLAEIEQKRREANKSDSGR
jgi:hypothetical protein